MACTRRAMSSVAFAVSCASSLTSLATTAKPLPASPARAASIVALSASRFVCSAMLVITFTTLPISADDAPSLLTVADVVSTAATALMATSLAAAALLAISRIEAPISSAPAATVATLRDTSSAAPATTPDWALVCSAPAEICDDDADSCSEEAATASADSTTEASTSRRLAWAASSAAAMRPTSSLATHARLDRQVTGGERLERGLHPADRPGDGAHGQPADQARRPAGRPALISTLISCHRAIVVVQVRPAERRSGP